MSLRNPLTGTSPLVPWLNSLRDYVRRSRIKSFKGGKLTETPDGLLLEAIQPRYTPPDFFPFKVYQSPPSDPSTDWRTFRVRSGALGPGLEVPDGTDAETDPYGPDIPDFDAGLIDFVVPDATSAYYVWIDCTDTAALVIDKGTTEPDYDAGDYVLIAKIDTNTDTAKKIAHVRQYVNSDLPVKLSICDATGASKTLWMPCGKQTTAPA